MSSQPSSNGTSIPYVPVAGQRAAARKRKKVFPSPFPRAPGCLGGKFDVAENAGRLRRFFFFERRLMQALGAWTLSIPDFEVNPETGRHIFSPAGAARLLRDR